MKRYTVPSTLTLLASFFALFSIGNSAIALEPAQAENKIRVQGIVLPLRTVTIDQYGTILQITSNTKEDVLPKIYVNSIQPANEVPLTDDVLAVYRELIPADSNREAGILYSQSTTQKSAAPKILNIQDLIF